MRRAIDVVVSTLCLVILAPLAVLIAVGTWLTSGSPVLHATPRVGRGGRVFMHYRFRTARGNPTVRTAFGRFIGNLSLDDIPSFFNAVRGDMSLVGPRPPHVREVRFDDPGWQKILSVRPGLVNPSVLAFLEAFNRTDVRKRIEPDVAYVDQRSWRGDVRLFLRGAWLILKTGHPKGRM